jgi:hypothetical protein
MNLRQVEPKVSVPMELSSIDGDAFAFSKYYVTNLNESVFRPELGRGSTKAKFQAVTVIEAFRETVKTYSSSLALISSTVS